MDKKGTKKVRLAGLDDKHQFLLSQWQVIFCHLNLGTTCACLPANKFPDSWHITYTHNHWCNEETVKLYIEKVIVPFMQKKKDELKIT